MGERNIKRLLLAHPQPGTWPATLARALTGSRTGPLSLWDDVQPSEPHQSELVFYFIF